MPKKSLEGKGHARRYQAVKSDGERAGIGGRPTMLDNQETRMKIISCAAAGATARDCSRMLGLYPTTVGEWLMRGELAVKEAQLRVEVEELEGMPPLDKYGRFYQDWWGAKTMGRVNALGILQSSEDPRMVDKWLTRTDEDMQYIDKDRLAGRPEVNVNLPGANLDIGQALAKAKETRRNTVRGEVIRELPRMGSEAANDDAS